MVTHHLIPWLYGLFAIYSAGAILMVNRLKEIDRQIDEERLTRTRSSPTPVRLLVTNHIHPSPDNVSSKRTEDVLLKTNHVPPSPHNVPSKRKEDDPSSRKKRVRGKDNKKKLTPLQKSLLRVDTKRIQQENILRSMIIQENQRKQQMQQYLEHEREVNYAAAVQARTSNTTCVCVDCQADELCGGLWRGLRYPDMPSDEEVRHKKVHIVVSHCNKSLRWMHDYLEGFTNIATIHVISKCGHEVEGAPAKAVIEVFPKNVGRCDHTFAYYITTILPKLVTSSDESNSVVVFLKDSATENIHQDFGNKKTSTFYRKDLKSLVQIASSSNGFSCGLSNIMLSPYHDKAALFAFNMTSYARGDRGHDAGVVVPFQSVYNTLGDFYNYLNAKPSPDLVQVCYGGIFAASAQNIFKRDMKVWKTLEATLTRGDNIQEGHYAERSWAHLLARPLEQFQIDALRKHSANITQVEDIRGALMLVSDLDDNLSPSYLPPS